MLNNERRFEFSAALEEARMLWDGDDVVLMTAVDAELRRNGATLPTQADWELRQYSM